MNQYSEILIYLKELAEAQPMVNTVTQGDIDRFDLNKANIYQIVHIEINSGSFSNGQTITFDVVLTCLQQRDTNKETEKDKFWEQDNEVDNHNETLATLNAMFSVMVVDFETVGINAEENPTLTKIAYEKTNILDGWSLTMSISVPNDTLNLCEST